MSAILAYIADRKRGVADELALNCEIPLLCNGRLDVRVPQSDDGIGKRISRRLQDCHSLIQGRGGKSQRIVIAPEFRRKGRIQRETQVGPGSLQIGRDSIGAPHYEGFIPECRIPGESEARLEGSQAPPVRVIQSAVVLVEGALARKLDFTAQWRKIHLPVFDLDPRSV